MDLDCLSRYFDLQIEDKKYVLQIILTRNYEIIGWISNIKK